MMEKRDLKANLDRLDMQVERELALIAREQKEAKKLLTTYNALEIVTRRAWAEETRAIKAEALARELVEALEKAIEEVKHPICGPGSAVEDLEATLAKTKEVLGDG